MSGRLSILKLVYPFLYVLYLKCGRRPKTRAVSSFEFSKPAAEWLNTRSGSEI